MFSIPVLSTELFNSATAEPEGLGIVDDNARFKHVRQDRQAQTILADPEPEMPYPPAVQLVSLVMDQKWITVGSETILKDRWIDLRADDCVTPVGKQISPYYVLSYPDWVHVVAVTSDGNLVLVRQYRHAANAMVLELPGGAVDSADADPEQAARRELEEETGFTARNWQLISSLYPNPATQTNRIHAYLAIDAVRNRASRLEAGEEGLQACIIPINEILDGLGAGILGQSMQVGAVLMGLAITGHLKLHF